MALPILKLGVESPLVIEVRSRLAKLGFPISIQTTMPHIYDSAVQATVSAFQQSVGLAADGVIGPATWAKLGADPTAAEEAVKGGMGVLGMVAAMGVAYFGYRYVQKQGGFTALFNSMKSQPVDAIDEYGDDDDYDEFGVGADDDDDENLLSPAEVEFAKKEARNRELEKKVQKRIAERMRVEKKAGYRVPSEPTSAEQREIFRKLQAASLEHANRMRAERGAYPEGMVWNYETDRETQAARKQALLMAHRKRQEERAEKGAAAAAVESAGEEYYPGLVGQTRTERELPGVPAMPGRVAVPSSRGSVYVGPEFLAPIPWTEKQQHDALVKILREKRSIGPIERKRQLPPFTPKDVDAKQVTHDHLMRIREMAESTKPTERCQAKGIINNWIENIQAGQLEIEDASLVETMLVVAKVVHEDTKNDNCPKPQWRERPSGLEIPFGPIEREQVLQWQPLGPSSDPTEALLTEPVELAEQGKCEEAARVLVKRRVFGTNISTPKDQRLFKRAIRIVDEYCPWELEAEVLREEMHAESWFPSEHGEQPSPLLRKHLKINKRAKADPPHDYDRDTLTALLRAQPDVGRGQRVLEKGIITSRSPQRLVPHVSASAGGKIVYIDNQGDEVVGQTVGTSSSEDATIAVVDSAGKKSVIPKARILRFLPKFGPLIASRPASERKITPEQRAADNALKTLRRAEKKAVDDAKKQAKKIAEHQLLRAREAAQAGLLKQGGEWARPEHRGEELRSSTETRVRPDDGDLDWYAASY